MKIKRNLIITSLLTTFLLGVVALSSGKIVSPAYAGGESVYDTHEVSLEKTEMGLTTSNKTFSVTKTHLTSSFVYSGTSNLTQASLGYYSIKTKTGEALKQSNAAGSVSNKWRVTKIVFDYTKVSTATGNLDVSLSTNAGEKTAFSFNVVTNSTSVANLNANAATQTVNYDFSDNIQTFTLIVSKILWVSKLTITYSIDYSAC